jgi:hypothetical protein
MISHIILAKLRNVPIHTVDGLGKAAIECFGNCSRNGNGIGTSEENSSLIGVDCFSGNGSGFPSEYCYGDSFHYKTLFPFLVFYYYND